MRTNAWRRWLAVAAVAYVAACATGGASEAGRTPEAAVATTVAAAPDRWLEFGDVRLRYREIGRGEPVVMLHGYSGRLDWAPSLADSLARDYRVILLDQRGFGMSSKFSDPARYGTEMVDDVARLLDHLDIEKANLVGHSMGAAIAARFAARHPDRVETAMLIAGPFRDSAALVRMLTPLSESLKSGGGLRPLLDFLFPMFPDSVRANADRQILAVNDRGALIATLVNPLPVRAADASRLKAPTVAMVGTADPLVDDSRALKAWWPNIRVVEVQGSNHADIVYRPEVLAETRALLRR
jgi:pimeloyl-ACP methyl ester carboxylesterase